MSAFKTYNGTFLQQLKWGYVLYVLSLAKKNSSQNFFDPKPNKGVAMQVLVIAIDDSLLMKKLLHFVIVVKTWLHITAKHVTIIFVNFAL